jgi:hypothetical protein
MKNKKKSQNVKGKKKIAKWVKDTDGYTLAHIKELILAVEVFNLGYDETLERLNVMCKRAESSGDYEPDLRGSKGLGFN